MFVSEIRHFARGSRRSLERGLSSLKGVDLIIITFVVQSADPWPVAFAIRAFWHD